MLTEKYKEEIEVFTDEYIKEENSKINNGTWIKYAAEPGNWSDKNANYIKLYNDLKDSGKDWDIAKDINACQNELCGEMIPSEGISSGDIYVYYEKQDNKDIPVFFIKISDLNKDKSYIEYNGTNSVFYGIDSKYISEVIVKLNELDKDKHKKHIDDLKIRYMEYSVLLSLLKKEELEEDEINFIYYMAYKRYDDKAISKIKDRNISEDFKNFSIDAKVRLFKNVTTSENQNNLIIDSKEIISKLAKEGYLNQLNNASKEIIDDREFVLKAVGEYFSSENPSLVELIRSVPEKYQTDIDVLHCIITNMPASCIDVGNWIARNHLTCSDKIFAYKILSAYLGTSMKSKWNVEDQKTIFGYALCPFTEEILEDVEEHLLIGPEPSKELEERKEQNINSLVEAKKKVLKIKKIKRQITNS